MSKDDLGLGKYVLVTDYCDKCNKIVTFYKLKKGKAYICSNCSRHLYYQAGTIFQDSHLSLTQWLVAFHNVKNNSQITIREISESIKVTMKTGWRVRKLLRENMEEAEKFLMIYFRDEHFKEEVHEEIGSVLYWGLAKPNFENKKRKQLRNLKSIKLTSKGKKELRK